jgi:four helix bundle protein
MGIRIISDWRFQIYHKPKISFMDKNQFKQRTKTFAISVAKFCKTLPYDHIIKSYIDQVVRASASVGANYRAACRGKSKPDFINKMRIVEEEADESLYFLELLAEFNPSKKAELRVLYREGNEILSMTVASINTTLKNLAK